MYNVYVYQGTGEERTYAGVMPLYICIELMNIPPASVLAGAGAGFLVTYLESLEALDRRVSCRCKLYMCVGNPCRSPNCQGKLSRSDAWTSRAWRLWTRGAGPTDAMALCYRGMHGVLSVGREGPRVQNTA